MPPSNLVPDRSIFSEVSARKRCALCSVAVLSSFQAKCCSFVLFGAQAAYIDIVGLTSLSFANGMLAKAKNDWSDWW